MLSEKILEYMQKEAYKPLTADDLLEAMGTSGESLQDFWQSLEKLEEKGEIIKTRHEKYGIPSRMNLVVGVLKMTGKGFGFVVPEKRAAESETDVFIPASMMMSAMNNDRVVARINLAAAGSRTREGEIIRIIERANKKIVGTFEASRSFGFVVPDDVKLKQDIFIPKGEFNGAKVGAKVVAEVTKWPDRLKSAEGRIIEVLGYKGDPGLDILSIIKKYDLPTEFPDEVMASAEKVPDFITEQEIKSRRDRRDLKIITIDGDDAKDLDDGVYAEKRGDKYFLGVYIADVSYYVREKRTLDKEAYSRGTSVYLVDRVLPMLPPRLSNGICSLNAGEDRLALCAEMEIDSSGKITAYEIFPTVIHVYRRMTYNIVKKILVDKEENFIRDNADILPLLNTLAEVREVLRRRRMNRGAIDFELSEVKVRLNPDGTPAKLEKRVRNLAESIIEECMLAANETVAEHMAKQKLPFIYRVHEEPSAEKLLGLNTLLAAFNLHIVKTADGEIKPKRLQEILKKVEGKPEERIISAVMLRSMKQARYEAENLGHFGLAAKFYTHFTSPIRRYPDLIVHRLLHKLTDGKLNDKEKERFAAILPDIAVQSSARERLAADAERETVDLKKIEYMAQFVGDEFDGVISGVTSFGIFVELDNGVEGLVRVSSMEDDFYQYLEEQYALQGERTRKIYRLGDEVKIIVVNANLDERNLDFVLEDNGKYSQYSAEERKRLIARENVPKKAVLKDDELIFGEMKKTAKKQSEKDGKKEKREKHAKRGKKRTGKGAHGRQSEKEKPPVKAQEKSGRKRKKRARKKNRDKESRNRESRD